MRNDEIFLLIVLDLDCRIPQKERIVPLLGLEGHVLDGIFWRGRLFVLVEKARIGNRIPGPDLHHKTAVDLFFLLNAGWKVETVVGTF